MKIRIAISGMIILMIIQNVSAQKSLSENKSFDSFGQAPPGDSARIFAPGIISKPATRESALALSPNGDEIFFVRGVWPNTKIMHTTMSDNEWSTPDTATFSKDDWTTEPSFSPDGHYLYFSSSRGKSDIKDYNLWRIEKTETGWSRPESLFDLGGDSIWEFHPSVTRDGFLYFCCWNVKKSLGDIYVSRCLAGKCSEPKRIDAPLNTANNDADPYISADGTYMIFSSDRPGGYGKLDQYISFKNINGTWTVPKNLGTEFNNREDNYDMDISPDGKYILLYFNDDIFWMRAGNYRPE